MAVVVRLPAVHHGAGLGSGQPRRQVLAGPGGVDGRLAPVVHVPSRPAPAGWRGGPHPGTLVTVADQRADDRRDPEGEHHLLVVWSSRGGSTRALVDAVLAGARHPDIEGVEVRSRTALDSGPDDLEWADALVLATPTHFGALAGLVKDWLERIYHPCLDRTRGLPCAVVVKGDTDVDGSIRQLAPILAGLGWREVQPPLLVVGAVTAAHLDAATELGGTMAAGLAYGGL